MYHSTSTLAVSKAPYLPTSHIPSTLPMLPAPSMGNYSYTHSNSSTDYSRITTISNVSENVIYEFGILLEISPNFFKISGDYQVTVVALECLESTFAGIVLLIEYDGCYRRIFIWLWQYWLRRYTSNILQIEAEAPDLFRFRFGKVFLMNGGSPIVPIHESVLERKWSGRLYIARWRQRRWVLVEYLWKDIRKGLAGLIKPLGITLMSGIC
ncbi:hypothetical protein EAF04_005365 [Stromatinia cepivora]|nr:hypothetical protein EAF04_005365 [Stromatinia cepivora]